MALVLAGCASHRSDQPAGGHPRTATTTFHAYRADGELAVQVADVATGTCWTLSIAVAAAGAYRCITGDEILDPCFAPARPEVPVEVACIADPWSRAEVLTVSGGLPKAHPGGRVGRPWAFELANGVRCVAATGTVPEVHGVDLGYHCAGGGDSRAARRRGGHRHVRLPGPRGRRAAGRDRGDNLARLRQPGAVLARPT